MMFLDVVLLSEWTGTVQQIYFDGVSLFLPIVVMKHWACLGFFFLCIYSAAQRDGMFPTGKRREREKNSWPNFFITIN